MTGDSSSSSSLIGFGVALVAILVAFKPKMMLGGVVFLLPVVVTGYIYLITSNRQAAFPEAQELIQTLETNGDVIRTRNYDLYLPKTKPTKAIQHAVLFLPGALVSHTAYVGIASRVAEQGIAFAVVNLEPTRLSTFLTGASLSRIKRLAKDIQDRLRATIDESSNTNEGRFQWSLAGHSMGAVEGTKLFPKLLQENANDIDELSSSSSWNKFIFCGVGGGLSSPLINHDNTLVIQASNDGFISFYPEEHHNENRKKCTFLEIKGGNHAGVAHYGPQTFPKKDGERTITLEDQQKQTADAILQFILSGTKKVRGAKIPPR